MTLCLWKYLIMKKIWDIIESFISTYFDVEIEEIKGEGVPYINSTRTGDLYIIIKVVIPTKLDKKQKELFNELSKTNLDDNNDFINKFKKIFRR